MSLVKFFLTCNVSIKVIENKHLRSTIKCNLIGKYTFRKKILPTVMKSLQRNIEEKLNKSEFVCLVSDIWSNKQFESFIAIVAFLIYNDGNREMVVLGKLSIRSLVTVILNLDHKY